MVGFSHSLPFDPTYGYDLEALLKVEPAPEPDDFKDFWEMTRKAADEVPLDLRAKPSAVSLPNHHVWEVSFASLDRVRIAGWLTLPKHGPAESGFVISHGYGGREAPDAWLPARNSAAIFPCARGLGLSRHASIPADSHRHVIHGLESRETYVHRGCVADVWAAASVLISMAPSVVHKLNYVGASFGGGIGALALPWDTRFRRAFLEVPSFGQHPLRLALRSCGSAEAVRNHVREHPEAARILSYFDASVAAKYIAIPTMVAAALFDPAVPPPGQFAVYNAIPGLKELKVMRAGHFNYAGSLEEAHRVRLALEAFMTPGGEDRRA